MKKPSPLLLILSLLVLESASFAGAPYAMAADDPAKTADKDKDAAKQAEDSKKKGPEDTTGGRFAGDPIYIHMAPLVLPVISENGVEQLVTIIMDVQVKDFDAADQIHSNMPRVQDALMRALYGGLGQGSLRNGKLVDIARVKNKAISAVGEVIGSDNVRDILIQGVSQRML